MFLQKCSEEVWISPSLQIQYSTIKWEFVTGDVLDVNIFCNGDNISFTLHMIREKSTHSGTPQAEQTESFKCHMSSTLWLLVKQSAGLQFHNCFNKFQFRGKKTFQLCLQSSRLVSHDAATSDRWQIKIVKLCSCWITFHSHAVTQSLSLYGGQRRNLKLICVDGDLIQTHHVAKGPSHRACMCVAIWGLS